MNFSQAEVIASEKLIIKVCRAPKVKRHKSDLDFQTIARLSYETYRQRQQRQKGGKKFFMFLAAMLCSTRPHKRSNENHQQSSSKLIQVILLLRCSFWPDLILLQSCLFCVLFSSSPNLPRTVEQEILTLEEKLKASRAFNTKSPWNGAHSANDETSKRKIFDSSQANVRSECRKRDCSRASHVSKMSKTMFMLLLLARDGTLMLHIF